MASIASSIQLGQTRSWLRSQSAKLCFVFKGKQGHVFLKTIENSQIECFCPLKMYCIVTNVYSRTCGYRSRCCRRTFCQSHFHSQIICYKLQPTCNKQIDWTKPRQSMQTLIDASLGTWRAEINIHDIYSMLCRLGSFASGLLWNHRLHH